ncbi:hypothetical protein PILCRDRAFT_17338 [Piloderma croceum F 1598]|uniref:Uncharacterized protein n=1 Tax=Piloderma croceum (strain F 1598) TaxID=765440 RepID=A0A0C3B1N5_PILCF|nr:hypothetical protein PILCRDRAFT_17338 [Piloderma croceum F 1598]
MIRVVWELAGIPQHGLISSLEELHKYETIAEYGGGGTNEVPSTTLFADLLLRWEDDPGTLVATELNLCRVRDVRSDRAFEEHEDDLAGEVLEEIKPPHITMIFSLSHSPPPVSVGGGKRDEELLGGSPPPDSHSHSRELHADSHISTCLRSLFPAYEYVSPCLGPGAAGLEHAVPRGGQVTRGCVPYKDIPLGLRLV